MKFLLSLTLQVEVRGRIKKFWAAYLWGKISKQNLLNRNSGKKKFWVQNSEPKILFDEILKRNSRLETFMKLPYAIWGRILKVDSGKSIMGFYLWLNWTISSHIGQYLQKKKRIKEKKMRYFRKMLPLEQLWSTFSPKRVWERLNTVKIRWLLHTRPIPHPLFRHFYFQIFALKNDLKNTAIRRSTTFRNIFKSKSIMKANGTGKMSWWKRTLN